MPSKLTQCIVNLQAALAQGWDKVQLFFLTKAGANRRNSERVAALQLKASEAERLDRLRNPSDYQGR